MIRCIVLFAVIAHTYAFGINKASSSNSMRRMQLPKQDPSDPTRYLPPADVDFSAIKRDYYPPIETVLRAGPVPLFIRTFQSDKYNQAILRYMFESKSSDWYDAQANMDAFFAAPDLWTEQKLLEQTGKRELYNYALSGKPTFERIVLSSIWATIVSGLFGRVAWQLIHGNRNLF